MHGIETLVRRSLFGLFLAFADDKEKRVILVTWKLHQNSNVGVIFFVNDLFSGSLSIYSQNFQASKSIVGRM